MDDYRDIRSIAIHAEDVTAAVETNRTGDSRTVLRVTPPFSGRMRARLHVEQAGEYADSRPEPIHIEPARLIADAPSYPEPDETEQRLRADPDTEYTVETHHKRHTEAVAAWREALSASIVESLELDDQHDSHRVTIVVLG